MDGGARDFMFATLARAQDFWNPSRISLAQIHLIRAAQIHFQKGKTWTHGARACVIRLPVAPAKVTL